MPTGGGSPASTSEKQHKSTLLPMATLEQQLLHLKLAFLALEPPACVLTLARKAGGGSVTPHVQKFILENCIGNNVQGGQNYTYLTTILKKIISERELSSDIVIDELYEEFGRCVSSKSSDSSLNITHKVCKEISFLSPAHDNVPSNLSSIVARLSCSTNMLEGDTGCSLWPSSLYLSEFILSYPKKFFEKCCFELGSGVGLVGVCLNYVGASKVILTDGDASTLTNMRANMEMNNLCIGQEDSHLMKESKNKVECKYLSWEEASESDLWDCQPDIVLGADIIYNPSCVPHLVQVLSMLLGRDGRRHTSVKVATNEESGREYSENVQLKVPLLIWRQLFEIWTLSIALPRRLLMPSCLSPTLQAMQLLRVFFLTCSRMIDPVYNFLKLHCCPNTLMS